MRALGCWVRQDFALLFENLFLSLLLEEEVLTDPFSWLLFKIVDIIRHRAVQHGAVIATGIITNVLVIISVLSAFPWVRK